MPGAKVGTSVLALEEYDDEAWGPSAVRADELPSGADEDELDEAEEKLHEERGQKGLNDLLLALAPYLNSPLVITEANFSSVGEFFLAMEWTIRPGATEVEIKKIAGMNEDSVP